MSEQLHFYLEKLQEHFGMHLPALLKAILILVVGWLVARIIAALVRGALTSRHFSPIGPQKAALFGIKRFE